MNFEEVGILRMKSERILFHSWIKDVCSLSTNNIIISKTNLFFFRLLKRTSMMRPAEEELTLCHILLNNLRP